MHPITGAELIETIRDFAKLAPDFEYTRPRDCNGSKLPCSYVPDAHNPLGCIVGAALAKIEPQTVPYFPSWPEIDGVLEMADPDSDFYFVYEVKDRAWLTEVQALQDDGVPWGEAVDAADHNTNWPHRKEESNV